ncbi:MULTISPECIES: CdaR family protein [unclassified Clostridium]|uniref:CdaR family protein n=1 Tax=unclassified Clostridium TaxID=2614128 RepID=UPI00207A9009|nr:MULTISPECIES: CdaR family protein [unclassified Clostridium]
MGKGNKNKSLVAKLICLLLSFGLWLYISNVENPVRTYELKGVPVELINKESISKSNLAIVGEESFTVDLTLEGATSEITKAKKDSFKLTADMSSYALKNGENIIPIQIVSYPQNINIKNNGFLGIKIKLETLITKDVSLKSQVNITYKENIYKKDLTVSPQKATISGPESQVNKVDRGILVGNIENLEKDINKKFPIKFVTKDNKEVKGITSNADEAELNIKVNNGKTVPINIKTIGNSNDGISIESMVSEPKSVHIIGEDKILNSINSIDTQEINISNITADAEVNTNLKLPEGVTIQENSQNVKVKFSVKKAQEVTKNISCAVEYTNLNPNLIIDSSKSTANVSISGLESVINSITEAELKATVDLSNISEVGTYTYKPSVISINNRTDFNILSVDEVQIVLKNK